MPFLRPDRPVSGKRLHAYGFINMRFTVLIVFTLFLSSIAVTIANCPEFSAGIAEGSLKSPLLNEASGLVASRKNANVLWAHNDSGDSARIFAMNRDGTHLGIYNLSGVTARDFEDIAIGPGPIEGVDYLYIGDIGDNNGQYAYITIYRVPEPVVDSNQLPLNITLSGVSSIQLQYPDGPKDAETLMLDPVTRDIYIISKRTTYARVYRAAYPQSTSSITTLEYKCQLPWSWAVGGDISSEGNMVIVRGYFNASVWYRSQGSNLWEAFAGEQCAIPLQSEPQGEAICFDSSGCGYYTVSEQSYQPIYYFARLGQCDMAADVVRDGVIDLRDFAAFAAAWPVEIEIADLNEDGIADLEDLSVLTNTWLEIELWP
jgi:hypothetical protein